MMKKNTTLKILSFIGKYIGIVFICAFFHLAAICAELECREKGTVTWIVDGDTIIVKLPIKSVKVRLLGIDTPEFHNKDGVNEYFAYEAFLYTKEHLKGKTVCLVKDPLNDCDIYGRILRYVYIDRRLFNAELLEGGYAEIYNKGNFEMKPYFNLLQQKAKKAHIGIWKYGKRYR